MKSIDTLFKNNRRWVKSKLRKDKNFFAALADQQAPDYLWIGCSDSRVPANEIVGLAPGEMFVHRNIANVVNHSDMNCLSVIHFAIEMLKVKHIIVCGHYGCGGVRAALQNKPLGVIDNWLRHIKDVYRLHEGKFNDLSFDEKLTLLCELNIREQVLNVCHTSFVQDAWNKKRPLSIHGLIYNIRDGLLKDLDLSVSGKDHIDKIYQFDIE